MRDVRGVEARKGVAVAARDGADRVGERGGPAGIGQIGSPARGSITAGLKFEHMLHSRSVIQGRPGGRDVNALRLVS